MSGMPPDYFRVDTKKDPMEVVYQKEKIGIEYYDAPAPAELQENYTATEGRMNLTFWTDEGWQPIFLLSRAVLHKERPDEVKIQKKMIERNIWREFERIMIEGKISFEENGTQKELDIYAVSKFAIVFRETKDKEESK